MDHLKLPQDAAVREDDVVPYVCQSRYDGEPFLTYPLRVSPPKPHFTSSSVLLILQLEEEDPTPTSELEIFFQTWLFFGLLREVFGDKFSYDDFLKDPASPIPKVTSCNLRALIDGLSEDLESCDLGELDKRENHINDCLEVTHNALFAIAPHLDVKQSDFNHNIRNSIVFLADAITQLRSRPFQEALGHHSLIEPRSWKSFVYDASLKSDMVRNGWCPSQIQSILGGSLNLETFWFISKMQKLVDITEHSKCDEEQCLNFQIDPQTYVPVHLCEGQACEEFAVDRLAVDSILEQGSYPLLQIKRDASSKKLTAKVVSASSKPSYIAISHVWADGMGNPHANELPQCQIAHVVWLCTKLLLNFDYRWPEHQCVLERRASSSFLEDYQPTRNELSDGFLNYDDLRLGPSSQHKTKQECLSEDNTITKWSGEILLWIDTLCCPTNPPRLKELSLNRMREVYEHAEDVLVLDRSLQQLEADKLSVIDLSFRITTSNWARRLWTAQEAYLARRLWIQFNGLPKLALQILDSLLNEDHFVSSDLLVGCVVDRSKAWPTWKEEDRGLDFHQVANIIKGRSVSVPSDEPLCLATLLGLDVKAVVECSTELDVRMAKVWELGCESHGIAQSILFHSGPRISSERFRWAPKSLLELPEQDLNLLGGDLKGNLTELGLCVNLAGFRVAKSSAMAHMDELLETVPDLITAMNSVRTNFSGAWLMCDLGDEEDWGLYEERLKQFTSSPNSELVVLLSLGTIDQLILHNEGLFYSALLGYVNTEDKTNIFHSIVGIKLAVWDRSYSRCLEEVYQIALKVSREEAACTIEDLPPSQRNNSNEIYALAVSQVENRIEELCHQKTKDQDYIQQTGGKFNYLTEQTLEMFCGGYAVITEAFKEQEWVVD